MRSLSQFETKTLTEVFNSQSVHKILLMKRQTKICKDSLKAIKTIMGHFETELGALSVSIAKLLNQYIHFQLRLRNAKNATSEIESFLLNSVIDDVLIAGIYQTPMDETFLHYVKQFNKKKIFIQSQLSTPRNQPPLPLKDIDPVMRNLQNKMLIRIRHHLLHTIYSFLDSNGNLCDLQQKLLTFRPMYHTLRDYQLQVSLEIQTQYIWTLSKLFSTKFEHYLLFLLQHTSPPSKRKFLGTLDSNTAQLGDTALFSLGDRDHLLHAFNSNQTMSSLVFSTLDQKKKISFEKFFLISHSVLLDTLSQEHLFETAFFDTNYLASIFSPILTHFHSIIDQFLPSCYDSILLLLLLLLLKRLSDLAKTQPHSSLSLSYLSKIKSKILARLTQLLDLNISSIKALRPKDFPKLDVTPHYLTRRYSEFIASVCKLSTQLEKNKLVLSKLKTLHFQFQELLVRMANFVEPFDTHSKLLLCINNYHLILNVLRQHHLEHTFQAVELEMLLEGETTLYVEYELNAYFPQLMLFLKTKTNSPLTKEDALDTAKSFASTWKSSMQQIDKRVMNSFSDLNTGTQILKKICSHLMTCYKLFEETVKKCPNIYQKVQPHIVSTANLSYELNLYIHQ